MFSGQQIRQRIRACTNKLGLIGQLGGLTNRRNREIAHQITFANTRIQHRRFKAWIGADKQQRIGIFNACNARVKNIIAARAGNLCTILATINMRAFQCVHQTLQGKLPFGADQITGNGGGFVALAPQLFGNQ